jgi:hypothetical protein
MVTADEWLEAHRAEQRADERGRPMRDTYEDANVDERRQRAKSEAGVADVRDDSQGETRHVDIREETERKPKRSPRHEGDWTRVPSADETADSVGRARRALREMRNREAGDQTGDQPSRDATLARWHADDERKASQARDDEAPVLTRF